MNLGFLYIASLLPRSQTSPAGSRVSSDGTFQAPMVLSPSAASVPPNTHVLRSFGVTAPSPLASSSGSSTPKHATVVGSSSSTSSPRSGPVVPRNAPFSVPSLSSQQQALHQQEAPVSPASPSPMPAPQSSQQGSPPRHPTHAPSQAQSRTQSLPQHQQQLQELDVSASVTTLASQSTATAGTPHASHYTRAPPTPPSRSRRANNAQLDDDALELFPLTPTQSSSSNKQSRNSSRGASPARTKSPGHGMLLPADLELLAEEVVAIPRTHSKPMPLPPPVPAASARPPHQRGTAHAGRMVASTGGAGRDDSDEGSGGDGDDDDDDADVDVDITQVLKFTAPRYVCFTALHCCTHLWVVGSSVWRTWRMNSIRCWTRNCGNSLKTMMMTTTLKILTIEWLCVVSFCCVSASGERAQRAKVCVPSLCEGRFLSGATQQRHNVHGRIARPHVHR